MLVVVERGEDAVGRVELDVRAVHPEDVGCRAAGDRRLQLGEVLLVRRDLDVDRRSFGCSAVNASAIACMAGCWFWSQMP